MPLNIRVGNIEPRITLSHIVALHVHSMEFALQILGDPMRESPVVRSRVCRPYERIA